MIFLNINIFRLSERSLTKLTFHPILGYCNFSEPEVRFALDASKPAQMARLSLGIVADITTIFANTSIIHIRKSYLPFGLEEMEGAMDL